MVIESQEKMLSLIMAIFNGAIRHYPLSDIFPEEFFHYGPDKLFKLLDSYGGLDKINIDDSDWSRGYIIDLDKQEVTMWALLGEIVAEKLERKWLGRKVVDLEGDIDEFIKRTGIVDHPFMYERSSTVNE